MKTYEIFQDGNFVQSVATDDLDQAFAEAKEFVASGEWRTPGRVRVSMSEVGESEYIRDECVAKIISENE